MSDLLKKISSRGYWRVVLRPTEFRKDRIENLARCEEIITGCQVSLRGWNYPHYSGRSPIVSGTDYIESQTNWQDYKELWRFHQSGQFIHLFGCEEDWWKDSNLSSTEARKYNPGEALEIVCTLYRITEIYEFASRLAQNGVFDEQMNLIIELNGMSNRKLIALNRWLDENYVCELEDLPFERQLSIQDLIAKKAELALEDALEVFERFNWRDCRSPETVAIFREDQKKFLERRL